ncbi:MAG: hypothetical protein K8R54_11260 [Bacteroidales bacterium]|nr:hypothetical protein [Bacteroidales bacterium]
MKLHYIAFNFNELKPNTCFIIVFFVIISGFFSCMSSKEFSVNQEKYLGNLKNPGDIYKTDDSDIFYIPFDINIKPMEKLMLVDFDGDTEYRTIELQLYNDSRGKGATVILYGKDGQNDVYYTDSVFADGVLFEDDLFENKEMEYALNVSEQGLNSFLKMRDKSGRKIDVKIIEKKSENKLTSMLAPVGGGIKTFPFFPFFYMHGFNLVQRPDTEIKVIIDDIEYKPGKIPGLANGNFVYMARYATKPVIAQINTEYDGQLSFININEKDNYKLDDMNYHFVENTGHRELKKMTYSSHNRFVGITFSPPVPDIINLKENIEIKGKFSMESDSITGIVAGEYQINSNNNKIIITLQPVEAYSPIPGTVWVKAYKWNAEITVDNDKTVNMKSLWIKKLNKQ